MAMDGLTPVVDIGGMAAHRAILSRFPKMMCGSMRNGTTKAATVSGISPMCGTTMAAIPMGAILSGALLL